MLALLVFFVSFLLYVLGCILHGTWTDYSPPEVLRLNIEGAPARSTIETDELSLMNWNIGYAGLGAESDFFYDDNRFFFSGGKMIQPTEELARKNLLGILAFLKQNPTDFLLIQEADSSSKRSYFIDQYSIIGDLFPDYCRTFALNFKVSRVPLPVCEPWRVMGKMHAGLATYSAYRPSEASRLQFPGEFPWPSRIFNLDRCMAVHRFTTKHPQGKELVLINTHNSAYDDGSLKAQEMEYLKKYILKEYEKGNYVIVGGDWNQCPPGMHYTDLMPQSADSIGYDMGTIPSNFMPGTWTWASDPLSPSHRKLVNPYVKGQTFATLIDFYLLSPNIEVKEVKTINMDFAYSDHQPVFLKVKLKGLLPESDSLPNPVN